MIKDRLSALREQMRKQKVEAYFIPGTDAHQSEYLPLHWQRRQWISGFTGSAGDVVVTQKKAGLWTDSRYFLQAENELRDSGIDLFKVGLPETPSVSAFISKELKSGQTAGLDPALFSLKESKDLNDTLVDKGIYLKLIETNLVDEIWEDQPAPPASMAFVLDEKYSGESVESKLTRIRAVMKENDTAIHVLTALDAIAWTFNIRANDIAYNPYLIAYAIISKDQAFIYADKKSIDRKTKKIIEINAVVRKYDIFGKDLKKLTKKHGSIWLDDSTVSRLVVNLLPKKVKVIYKESPVTQFKAHKNETEIQGFRDCHVRDGAAMARFLRWLQEAVPKGGVTELSASAKLEEYRAKIDLYQGPSFASISGYGEHGAIVHYSSSEETDVELRPEGVYLIDSGGQYLDGTTDITRTVTLGEPTDEQKDRFTRVLKGHIALAICRFPVGTQGIQLDTLARKPLWDIELNYGHGTGHGVGHFLGVHEGPQGISYYRGIGVALEPGMVTSNEPGFYKEGEYGIRIENLIVVNPPDEDNGFLSFETITFCPIDRKLIEPSLLSETELEWLNHYQQQVYDKLSPQLKKDEAAWLKNVTMPVA